MKIVAVQSRYDKSYQIGLFFNDLGNILNKIYQL